MGVTGFHRRFIKGYATITAPLFHLLTKEQLLWSLEAPVLFLPDFSKPFTLEIDALGSGMGAVLSQNKHPIVGSSKGVVLFQNKHPIAFFSKQFCPRLLQASTYVRELCTITASIKKWRQYLLGHPFVILTDHRSLKELMAQTIQTPEQQKYLMCLMGYDFII